VRAEIPALITACRKNSASTTATRRSGDDEGGIETHLQPHLFGHTALNTFTLGVAGIALLTSLLTLAIRACRNWRRCGRSASRGGDWRHRASEDDVGRAGHGAVRAAARALVAWCLLAIVNVKPSAGGCRSRSFQRNCCGCSP
jgi:hypothetical protein